MALCVEGCNPFRVDHMGRKPTFRWCRYARPPANRFNPLGILVGNQQDPLRELMFETNLLCQFNGPLTRSQFKSVRVDWVSIDRRLLEIPAG